MREKKRRLNQKHLQSQEDDIFIRPYSNFAVSSVFYSKHRKYSH